MQIKVKRYNLQFKQPFQIAHGMRYHTEALYVEVYLNNVVGYGEATFPPYLSYNRNVCIALLQNCKVKFDADTFLQNGFQTDLMLPPPANAALSMALFDLYGKLIKKPIHQVLQAPLKPVATYTIGMCALNDLPQKLEQASDFKLLKIKLGGHDDKAFVKEIKRITSQAFCVDANQGWTNIDTAIKMIDFLYDMGCTFVEQPLPVAMHDTQAELIVRSKLPLIADESCQTVDDVKELANRFNGINIKLMKCGGLHEALQLIHAANQHNLTIMLGCMSEGSVGCSAAAQLAGYAQTVDLDGPLLNSNDPFNGITYHNGALVLNHKFGIGVTPNNLYKPL
ncbi:MAG: dipeptide epimerase [Bacteroidia bacterium]|nr:dipeptide epimerase [Bacteroidia bacterium]HQU99584.1 dipeptide epimerase [Bacteroidia bacterium]